MAHDQKHEFHLVNPSPWPIIGAFAAGLMAVGALLFMHDVKLGSFTFGLKGVLLGLAGVLAVMAVWWRDIIREAQEEGHHTPIVQLHHRYGMALFIMSEVAFFAAFFWAFFNAAFYPTPATGGMWPPKDIVPFDPFDIPLLNTLVLLLSGTTVTWAHHALLENDRKGLVQGLATTVFLGLCFTALQAFEYIHAPFKFTGGIYPSTFFMATGFHGFHVIVGTIFLAVCLWRAKRGDFTPEQHFGFEAAAWYWHFVDVVWLFLFVSIYWWGGQ
ncbi:MAG: cytochrome c oxidase subunit 3 [Dongiaceae bacterium]